MNKIYLEEDKNEREYIFILGNNYKLSILEVINYLKNNKYNIVNFRYSENVLICLINGNLDTKNVIKNLGGVIKVGDFLGEVKNLNIDFFKNVINENITGNKKINFGFSTYSLQFNLKISNLKNLGLSLKKELKAIGNSVRFVIDNNLDKLSSVTVEKNKLLDENGFEFLVIKDVNNLLIFKTTAVQEFEDYSKRDFGRPNRDSKSGMLPPKLCKMMINLSNQENKDTMVTLDPFCGSGTMLQELILLGYKNIIGTDLSEKATEDSNRNIEWIIKENKINSKINYNIIKADVRNINKIINEKTIDLVVTEPFLGPNNIEINNVQRVRSIISELEKLYFDAFIKFKEILKTKSEIIIIFPVFKIKQGNSINFFKLNILDKVQGLGFKKVIFSELLNTKANLNLTPKNIDIFKKNFDNVLYYREDQRVYREIHKFIKL